MADWYYGSKNHHWRAACGFDSSWDGYGQTFRLEVGAQAEDGYSYDIYGGANWEIWFNGALIGSGSTPYSVGANGYQKLGYAEVHYNRQQWDQTFQWSVKVSWSSAAFGGGSSTCSGSCWEAALDHHTVSYNGNGGSTPAAQTKWYGTILTLAGTPSRTGYGFDGWKGSDGTTYAAGGQYTKDADCTMTAQWHALYKPPTCTLKAVRTASSGATAESPTGGYAYVTAEWAVDTSATSGNAAKSVKLEYRASGASSWTALTTGGTQTGTSGTATAHFAASTTTAYEVRATVTDAKQATSWTAGIGYGFATVDFGNKGKAVAFGVPAVKDGFTLGMESYCTGPSGKVYVMPPVIYADTKPAEADVPFKPCIVVVKGGTLYLYE